MNVTKNQPPGPWKQQDNIRFLSKNVNNHMVMLPGELVNSIPCY